MKLIFLSSVAQSCPALRNPMDCSMPGSPVHHQLPKLTQTHVHQGGDVIQPSHPLSFPSPPTFNLSQHQGLFQWVSSSHQVPKYWSFSFSNSPSNEYSGLISFRMDWLDLLAVQGTLKSSPKASILWHAAFIIVQLSHPYMTTGKTIALTRQTFVGKVMSLLFNMLSRFVIAFLSRSKHLLISWLESPSAVIYLRLQQLIAWPLGILWSVTKLCPTLCDPMDYSLPGSFVHGILQAKTLEWVAISSSRGSYQPRDWTHIS